MDFGSLALICLVGLVTSLSQIPKRRGIPPVVAELAVGIVLGATWLRVLDADDATFRFLGEIGFALVMFVAGSRVPVHEEGMRSGLVRGLAAAFAVGVLAVPAGLGIASVLGTPDHAWVYAVVIASSSATMVLPTLGGVSVSSRHGVAMLVQIAVADALAIVFLPLVLEPSQAGRAALGAATVLGAAGLIGLVIWLAGRGGRRRRMHALSEDRRLAFELRVVLAGLFGLAAIAVLSGISVMIAGFAMGVVVAILGEPKRVAHQMFALTEGFFGPVFFVWIGASLDLTQLAAHPEAIALGVVLGITSIAVHLAPALAGQPFEIALATAAQLGVPIAAVALGTSRGLFAGGEDAALLLGALVTIGALALVVPRLRRAVTADPASGPGG